MSGASVVLLSNNISAIIHKNIHTKKGNKYYKQPRIWSDQTLAPKELWRTSFGNFRTDKRWCTLVQWPYHCLKQVKLPSFYIPAPQLISCVPV